MKLSEQILAEYQQRLELINLKRNLLEESNKELKELEKGSLKDDDFNRWDVLTDEILNTERSLDSKRDILLEKLPNLKQAYKDALFMEGEIERKDEPEFLGVRKSKEEEGFTVITDQCANCGAGLVRDESMVLLCDPPKFRYDCISCGKVQYKAC